jgi:hypothetical protein
MKLKFVKTLSGKEKNVFYTASCSAIAASVQDSIEAFLLKTSRDEM